MSYRVSFAVLGLTAALGAQSTNFFTPAEVEAEIDALVAANPSICAKIDLTTLPGAVKTHQGRSIWALKVSDNVAVDEDEPAMAFIAQHHARELNAAHVVIHAMQTVVNGYGGNPALTAAVDRAELFFVPCANPDGVQYVWSTNNNWRKNRRNNGNGSFGVDINRNYPFLWGLCGASSNTNSDTYKGPSAGSEPETKTIIAFHQWLRPDFSIDFHNFGREVLFLYPPCANVSSQVRGLANFFVNDLRNPMNYATRNPSASGEAPHDHWARGGAMALLVECSTSFQPSWNASLSEVARVWPGLENAILTWNPSLRGKIRSVTGQPLVAQVRVQGNMFRNGEYAESRGRDGNYVWWLPQNQVVTLQVSAPGYQTATRTILTPAYNSTLDLDFDLTPNGVQPSVLTVQGSNAIGTTTQLSYSSPGDGGDAYWIAVSGGTEPPITVGGRVLGLRNDGILAASAAPGAIPNNIGTLDGSGNATASVPIPNDPALQGISLSTAGVTFDPAYLNGVKKISSTSTFTIQ